MNDMENPFANQFYNYLINTFKLGQGSANSYLSYLKSIPTSIVSNGGALIGYEKDYLFFVAMAVAGREKDWLSSFLSCFRSKVNNYATKNEKTAFTRFCAFVDTLMSSQSGHALCGLYSQADLRRIIKSRLRTQSRYGKGRWLPLTFISIIDKQSFKKYVEGIYDRLKVIIECNSHLIHANVKCLSSIGITTSGEVYCFCCSLPHQVYTPSGRLNFRQAMAADDISDIVIDHVTPIGSLLFSLNLPQLTVVTDHIKSYQAGLSFHLANKDLEKAAASIWTGKISLNNDLTTLLNSSHYRLVQREYNSAKGSNLSYQEVYTDGVDYYAFLGEADGGTSVIYQKLSTQDLSVFQGSKTSFTSNKHPVSLSVVPIDLL